MQNRKSIFSAKAFFSILAIFFLLFAAIGCDDSDSTSEPVYNPPASNPVLEAVRIDLPGALDPANPELIVGQELAFTASDKYEGSTWWDATTAPGTTWSSSDPAILTVDQDGKVTAKAPGTATVTFRQESKKDSVRVTVVAPPPVVSYQLSAPNDIVEGTEFSVVVSQNSENYLGETTKVELTSDQLAGFTFSAEDDMTASPIGSAAYQDLNGNGRPTFLANEAGGVIIYATLDGTDVAEVAVTIEPPPPVLLTDPTSLKLASGGTEVYVDLLTQQGDNDPVALVSGEGVVATLSQNLAAIVTATVYGDGAIGIMPEADYFGDPVTGSVTITYGGMSATVSVTVAPQPPELVGYQAVIGGKAYPLGEEEGPRTMKIPAGTLFRVDLQEVYDHGEPTSTVGFTPGSNNNQAVRVNEDGSLQAIGTGRAEVSFDLLDGMQLIYPLVVISQTDTINNLGDRAFIGLTENRVFTDNNDPTDDDVVVLKEAFPACFNDDTCSRETVTHVSLFRVPESEAGIVVDVTALTQEFWMILAAYTVPGDGTNDPVSPVWVEFRFLNSDGNALGSAWRQTEVLGFIDGGTTEAVYVGAQMTKPEGTVTLEIIPEVSFGGAPLRVDIPRVVPKELTEPGLYYDGNRDPFPALEVQ